MQILLIEDDVDLSATIADYLEAEGVEVDRAHDGLGGLHIATTSSPDVIVLDIGLPGISGLELCKKLRNEGKSDVPVLMLTARDALEDKLEGFDHGADDYLVKPFALAELHRRLLALHRRATGGGSRTHTIADLVIDLDGRAATRGGTPIPLSKLEFDILTALAAASPGTVRKEELARRVWGEDYVEDETIRAHIYQLRKAIDRPFDTPLLHTIRGYGHALKPEAP